MKAQQTSWHLKIYTHLQILVDNWIDLLIKIFEDSTVEKVIIHAIKDKDAPS